MAAYRSKQLPFGMPPAPIVAGGDGALSKKIRRNFEKGLIPEVLLSSGYGHAFHVWDLRRRRHQQVLDLGKEHQLVFEVRPAHNPSEAYGFVGVVLSLKDLSSSIWMWNRNNGNWDIRKVIEIPAEPADPEKLPPMQQRDTPMHIKCTQP